MKALNPQRYEEIKSAAVELLVYCGIETFPLHPSKIIEKLGGLLLPYSSFSREKQRAMLRISMDGFSFWRSGTWYVLYNDAQKVPRIRMTLLHEISHRWLNHSEESDLAELEAKFFAKYVMAPPIIIHKLGLREALQIVACFGSSYEAATYSWDFYQKWLHRDKLGLSEQELKLINLTQNYIDEHTQRR